MINKPKGTYDLYGEYARRYKEFSSVVDTMMETYNYGFIRTPLFESSELFHRGIGDTSDIVSKETYDFTDRGNRNMTLRPEGTAGAVRSFIENKMYADNNLPVKLYYNGPMYRYERPQAGRFREFYQFGIELLGTNDPYSDVEVISIAYNLYMKLGLPGVKVRINTLGDKESRDNYREALLNYFKPNMKDLCEDCNNRYETNPLRILDCKIDKNSEILKNAPKTTEYLNEDSQTHFDKVKEYLDILSIPYEVDTNIVRGLDYYNHTVFEFTCEVEALGNQNVIGGGGRYNGLVELMDGPSTPAVGFGVGIERVLFALEEEQIKIIEENKLDAFIMYVNEEEKKYAIHLAQRLRSLGFISDMEYESKSLKAQFKKADKLNSKYLVILNSEDIDKDVVKIKNNITKTEEEVDLSYLEYYLEEKIYQQTLEEIEEEEYE